MQPSIYEGLGLDSDVSGPESATPNRSVMRLPEATRGRQLKAWGIALDHVGSRPREARDRALTDYEGLDKPLAPDAPLGDNIAALGPGAGWTIATVSEGGGRSGGLTSHRGTLCEDEHVDPELLARMIEERLGFTIEQVHSVYRQGRLDNVGRVLRRQIDDRLLEVEEAGGNLTELGRALGFKIRETGECRTLGNAVARARARQPVAA